MTFTFKLSRRLASARALGCLAAVAVSIVGCGTENALQPSDATSASSPVKNSPFVSANVAAYAVTNEPAGYSMFAVQDGGGITAGQVMGSWATTGGINLTWPSVTGAPSGTSVIQTRFPKGMVSGKAPANLWGWDVAGHTAGQKQKVYLSLYMQFVGADYENQPVGTKLGFLGYAQATTGAANQGFFLLNGIGSEAIRSSFTIRFMQQDHVNRSLNPNMGNTGAITCGVWHHIETVFEMNTVGVANGVYKLWVDGVPISDYRNVVYATSTYRNGFFSYKWNPTWGGMGTAVKTRDDYIQMDQIYLSGAP